jgi:prepilin-type N-terminal cleavage/methylation domain-containing protein
MRRFGRGDNCGHAGERGDTLAEVLVALTILAVAIVFIVGAMATAFTVSARHRRQAQAVTFLSSAAENVKSQALNPYVACASANPPYNPSVTMPSGWTLTVDQWKNVDAAGSSANCPSGDTKVQQMTVTVTTNDGYTISTDVVKRNPA